MKAKPFLLFWFALTACTAAPDSVPAADEPAADSDMVVSSESRVPSAGYAAEAAAGSERGPRVVFLGTSLTAGHGLADPDRAWVGRLDAIGDSLGVPFHAVNAGVSGETSAGGLRRLDWVLREPVDVLVVELGANDGLRGHDVDALEENLSRIIERTRSRYPGASVLLAGMEAPPNLGELYTSAFRQVFVDVARREGVPLIPFLLEGVAGIEELNQADGIHPTAEGHRRIAEHAWPYLEPLVRGAAGGS